jgi:hypothetical protein
MVDNLVVIEPIEPAIGCVVVLIIMSFMFGRMSMENKIYDLVRENTKLKVENSRLKTKIIILRYFEK